MIAVVFDGVTMVNGLGLLSEWGVEYLTMILISSFPQKNPHSLTERLGVTKTLTKLFTYR